MALIKEADATIQSSLGSETTGLIDAITWRLRLNALDCTDAKTAAAAAKIHKRNARFL